ncbi:MAG: TraB/GumN family protein, partial [Pseudomonadota bacterium]
MGRIVSILILIAATAGAYWYFAMRETPAANTGASAVTVEESTPEEPAEENDGPQTIEEATAGDSNVALWKTGDEDTTVYLMGTIHILKPGLAWENDTFEAAWAASDIVYFEADVLSQEAAEAAAPVVMSEGFYTDGRTFADLFTEEEAEMLDETLSEFGLSVSSVGNMRPWFVSIQLAQLALGKAGGDPAAGVEMILGARAAEEGKSQRFFETMSEQIEIIASIPDDVWATSL